MKDVVHRLMKLVNLWDEFVQECFRFVCSHCRILRN